MSLVSALPSRATTPRTPLAKRTGAPSTSWAARPPTAPKRRKPPSSMWVTTKPMESMWAANMIFLPGPFLWQIRLPRVSVVISST